MEIEQTIRVHWQQFPSEVETCALEVAEYLNDHSNWQKPVFPDEAGCSRLQVFPKYFSASGMFWNCDNQLHKDICSITTRAIVVFTWLHIRPVSALKHPYFQENLRMLRTISLMKVRCQRRLSLPMEAYLMLIVPVPTPVKLLPKATP